jgi:hypothetical protein
MPEDWFSNPEVVAAHRAMVEAQDAWRGVAPIDESASDQLSDMQRERLAAARDTEKTYLALRDAAMRRGQAGG